MTDEQLFWVLSASTTAEENRRRSAIYEAKTVEYVAFMNRMYIAPMLEKIKADAKRRETEND